MKWIVLSSVLLFGGGQWLVSANFDDVRGKRADDVLVKDNNGDKNEGDDDKELREERELQVELAKRLVVGLSEETDDRQLDEDFLELVEHHYEDYYALERNILRPYHAERRLEGEKYWAFMPPPSALIREISGNEKYTAWTERHGIDGEAWVRRIVRLRALLGVMWTRAEFDTEYIRELIEELKNNESEHLPDEIVEAMEAEYNRRLLIAPHVHKILEEHEPDWTNAERALQDKYGPKHGVNARRSALLQFLDDPEYNSFSKTGQDHGEDKALREERELQVELAKRLVVGLSEETYDRQLDEAFIELVERHYREYFALEGDILRSYWAERRLERDRYGTLMPDPRDFVAEISKNQEFAVWAEKHGIDGEAWVRRIVRLRALLGVMRIRNSFDTERLQKVIEEIEGLSDELSDEQVDLFTTNYRRSLEIAPYVIGILDEHEPEWSEAERALRNKYGPKYGDEPRDSQLLSFLDDPIVSSFSKAEVDRSSQEEEERESD
jgi:hypothetical protein